MIILLGPIALAAPAPAQDVPVTLDTERDPVAIEATPGSIVAVRAHEQGVPGASDVTPADAIPPNRDGLVNKQGGPGMIPQNRSRPDPALTDEPFERGLLPQFPTVRVLNLAKERGASDIDEHDLGAPPSCQTPQALARHDCLPPPDGVGCRGQRLGGAGRAVDRDLVT